MRKNRGLSRKSIADRLNISESFYRKIEYGTRNPTLELAKKIADILGADSIEEIFFNEEGDEMEHKYAEQKPKAG